MHDDLLFFRVGGAVIVGLCTIAFALGRGGSAALARHPVIIIDLFLVLLCGDGEARLVL